MSGHRRPSKLPNTAFVMTMSLVLTGLVVTSCTGRQAGPAQPRKGEPDPLPSADQNGGRERGPSRDEFARKFGEAWCASLVEQCEPSGFEFLLEHCRELAPKMVFGEGTYHPAIARRCLAGLPIISKECFRVYEGASTP